MTSKAGWLTRHVASVRRLHRQGGLVVVVVVQVASQMRLVLSPDGAALHIRLDLKAAAAQQVMVSSRSVATAILDTKAIKNVVVL